MRAFGLLLLSVIALCVLAFAALWGLSLLPDREDTAVATAVVDGNVATQVERGRYLALAGNCAGCHSARDGAAYAGGRAIRTPFGTVYSSNLTPDLQSGIGAWSGDDFWRAMHHGRSRDGRPLYPAFPYPNYTRVTRADSDALLAWLKTLQPVAQANREHALRFPYNNRLLLAGWRALYFRPGVYAPDAGRDAHWNRGAYLVQGLGHCSACHTSRDALGGSDLKSDLAGGMIPMLDWYAPSLTADAEAGLGQWQAHEIVELLRTGVSARGAVFGPMAAVVAKSLQHLSEPDLAAMAAYLKSLPQTPPPRASSVPPVATADARAIMAAGEKLYARYCADCHAAGGEGIAPAYPPLAGNRAISMDSAVNAIRIVLNGGFAPGTAGNPRPYGMPPFRISLNDAEVAAVVSYVRNSWGNRAGLVSPVEVDRFRSAPVD
jgi:mono/diheme cytochrome c family protein